jgi:hypothetical protein
MSNRSFVDFGRHLVFQEDGIYEIDLSCCQTWGDVARMIDRDCRDHLARSLDRAAVAFEPAAGTVLPSIAALTARGEQMIRDALGPVAEEVVERPKQTYEEWLESTTALLAEQEARHE